MTVFFKDGKFGVCSRNWELREAEGNTLWAVAREYGLEKILSDHAATDLTNIALQGELIGPGIQDNKYKLTKHAFYIFDIYNIDRKQYLSPGLRKDFIERHGLRHVPVFSSAMKLDPDLTMDALLKEAEGKSVMGDITGPEREGHVYKCNELPVSFKCISNRFLLKEK
jgi:ATP-dependent RNA circularization protein (DNA/RNA ligase family)